MKPWAATALLMAGLLAGPVAHAGISAGGWTRSSQVADSVTNNGNGTWTYAYTVRNTSAFDEGSDSRPVLVDWELPWFGDAGISLASIRSPRNWSFSIETIGVPNASTGWGGVADWQVSTDPFYEGPSSPYTTGTQVLHWFNVCFANTQQQIVLTNTVAAVADSCEGQFDNAVFPDEELDGFGFDAAYAPTGAPYQASWAFLPVRTGDPAFPIGAFPNSPAVQGNRVDEPTVPALLLLAGAAALGLRRLRKSR